MSLAYSVKESFWGFRRAKLSTALSIVTVCIALVSLGLYAAININTGRLVHAVRGRVEMEAFIKEPASPEELHDIRHSILKDHGVDSVGFVSKEEAARIYRQQTGEDVLRVLNFNPLPPSFKVYIKEAYRTSARAREVYDRLSAIAGIDTVVYRRDLLNVVESQGATLDRIMLGLGLFIAVSALLLVMNTIRLTIHAKRRIIQTMEFVGATRFFIRRPFVIEGFVHGLIGGVLAASALFLLIEKFTPILSPDLGAFVHLGNMFYLLLASTGGILGILGSTLAVLRFLPRN